VQNFEVIPRAGGMTSEIYVFRILFRVDNIEREYPVCHRHFSNGNIVNIFFVGSCIFLDFCDSFIYFCDLFISI
jgi:hypothetical protein